MSHGGRDPGMSAPSEPGKIASAGVSERTVHGEWRVARAWLVRALRGAPAAGG